MTSTTKPDDEVRRQLTVGWPRRVPSRRVPSRRHRAEPESHKAPAVAAVATTGLTLALALLIGASPLSARTSTERPVASAPQHRAPIVSRQGGEHASAKQGTKPAPVAPPPAPVAGTHLMVDMASAPSLATVRRWQRTSPYQAIGVYVHVAASADDRHDKRQRHLTAAWVSQVRAGGWKVLPIYLAAQAPSIYQHGGFHTISADPVSAQRQGIAAASDAARSTDVLGLSGMPVMYDMEPYRPGCGAAVRSFFLGWTSRLHQLGRLAGIYGVPSSLGRDLLAAPAGYRQPDVLWAATANGSASTAVREIPRGRWSGHRANQFALDVARKYGGKKLHVDDSAVDDGVWSMTHTKGRDTAAPVLTVGDLAAVSGKHATLRWTAIDDVSASVALRTQLRRTSSGAAAGAWSAPAATGRSVALRLRQGEQACVRMRATDAAGNASHRATRCTVRLVDDTRLRHGRGWHRSHQHGAYGGSVTTSKHRHARLALGQTQRGSLGVLLRGKGSVGVLVNGRRVATLHAGGLRRVKVPAGKVTLLAGSAHVSVDGYVLTAR